MKTKKGKETVATLKITRRCEVCGNPGARTALGPQCNALVVLWHGALDKKYVICNECFVAINSTIIKLMNKKLDETD